MSGFKEWEDGFDIYNQNELIYVLASVCCFKCGINDTKKQDEVMLFIEKKFINNKNVLDNRNRHKILKNNIKRLKCSSFKEDVKYKNFENIKKNINKKIFFYWLIDWFYLINKSKLEKYIKYGLFDKKNDFKIFIKREILKINNYLSINTKDSDVKPTDYSKKDKLEENRTYFEIGYDNVSSNFPIKHKKIINWSVFLTALIALGSISSAFLLWLKFFADL